MRSFKGQYTPSVKIIQVPIPNLQLLRAGHLSEDVFHLEFLFTDGTRHAINFDKETTKRQVIDYLRTTATAIEES